MSDETENTDPSSAAHGSQKGIGLKLVLLSFIPVLLLGGVGAVLYFTNLGDPIFHRERLDGEGKKDTSTHDLVFFDIPELLVNLNTVDKKKPSFLRLVVKLELGDADVAKSLEKLRPRIIDSFQVYLRELRPEDLQGSAGIQRLREELLKRVGMIAESARIKDVLFESMLVQ